MEVDICKRSQKLLRRNSGNYFSAFPCSWEVCTCFTRAVSQGDRAGQGLPCGVATQWGVPGIHMPPACSTMKVEWILWHIRAHLKLFRARSRFPLMRMVKSEKRGKLGDLGDQRDPFLKWGDWRPVRRKDEPKSQVEAVWLAPLTCPPAQEAKMFKGNSLCSLSCAHTSPPHPPQVLESRHNVGTCGGGQPCPLLFPKASGFPGERVSPPKERAGQLGVGLPSPPRFGNQVRQGRKQLKNLVW